METLPLGSGPRRPGTSCGSDCPGCSGMAPGSQVQSAALEPWALACLSRRRGAPCGQQPPSWEPGACPLGGPGKKEQLSLSHTALLQQLHKGRGRALVPCAGGEAEAQTSQRPALCCPANSGSSVHQKAGLSDYEAGVPTMPSVPTVPLGKPALGVQTDLQSRDFAER